MNAAEITAQRDRAWEASTSITKGMLDAMDECERLRAENARLRAALEAIAKEADAGLDNPVDVWVRATARAALAA